MTFPTTWLMVNIKDRKYYWEVGGYKFTPDEFNFLSAFYYLDL